MANEVAVGHLMAPQRRKAGEGYLRAGRYLYERWGARRKVEHLDEEFAQLLAPQTASSVTELQATTEAGFDSASLDMASVIKASQAISSEIVLERLWATTMRVMLENAGGERGCFVVGKGEQFVMEGLSEVGREAAETARSNPIDDAVGARSLPISIVSHVLHTNSPVILHDVARAGRFARDAYLLACRPQSLLCIPLRRH